MKGFNKKASGEKKSRRRYSLFFKYVSFFSAVEILGIVVFGMFLLQYVSGVWEAEQKQKLFECANSISKVYASYASQDSGTTYDSVCYSVESISETAYADVYIVTPDREVAVCGFPTGEIMGEAKPSASAVFDFRVPAEIYTGIITDGMLATRSTLGGLFDEERFVSAAVVQSENGTGEAGIVFVVQSLDTGLLPYRASFLKAYIAAAMVLIFVTCCLIYVSTYHITRPLKNMTEATKHYSDGDFSYRIKRSYAKTAKEFDEVAAAINSMADSLEQHENSRAAFVANVSHELKTPMTTIGGFIDGMLDGTIADSEHDKYLSIVSDEVRRLSRLVVAMLNMSKIEAGELCINPENYNLTQQLIGIFMSFEQKINDKKIEIKGLDSLVNIYIEADRDMINQVFYNLVDNAVKFTQHGGEIFTSMTVNEGELTVVIRNTGKTIGKEDIDHIFERFYKADKSRSLDANSAGLGLFIVKNIVNLHSGDISVDNINDKYTQFTVRLKTKLRG